MYYVYRLTNSRKTVLYTGATGDLEMRIYFHKRKLISGFTKKYNVDQLIYWETYEDKEQALDRERQIKSYSREKKSALIDAKNSPSRSLFQKEMVPARLRYLNAQR